MIRTGGGDRARYLIEQLLGHARRAGANLPLKATTPYVNTIPATQELPYPGDRTLEKRLEAYMRWNAVAMVQQAFGVSLPYQDIAFRERLVALRERFPLLAELEMRGPE